MNAFVKNKNAWLFIQKSIFLSFVFLFHYQTVTSQITLHNYLETGKNNASVGVYADFATDISYNLGNVDVSAGALLTFSASPKPLISGFCFRVSNEFTLPKNNLTAQVFYLQKPFSDILFEISPGILAFYKTKNWGYQLGLHTRIYRFTNKAIADFQFSDETSTRIWEPLNAMYRISYYYPFAPKWELQASVTNFDNFMIQQETNPMLLAKFSYKLNTNMLLYADLGYLQAGLLNMRVDYFGFFGRGGLQWKL
jgi:hypothetical protein